MIRKFTLDGNRKDYGVDIIKLFQEVEQKEYELWYISEWERIHYPYTWKEYQKDIIRCNADQMIEQLTGQELEDYMVTNYADLIKHYKKQ